MKKNTKTLIALAVMLAASSQYAAAMNEIEENHPVQSSQYITVNGGAIQLDAAIGVVGATQTITTTKGTYTVPAITDDLDYYSFYAKAGDVVNLDIDHGIGGQQAVDTIIAVFDSSYTMLRMNDEADTLDAGSDSTADAFIQDFVVPADGVYYVGVSNYPRYFQNGGSVEQFDVSGGDYQLNISGVSAPSTAKLINIEVRPGSRALVANNPNSKGKIPVALLSGNNFNAMDIDQSTLRFGSNGTESSLSKCNPSGQDVNKDGKLDLVCHFENQSAGFKAEDIEGIATGKTRSGEAFEGRAVLKVVPAKTK